MSYHLNLQYYCPSCETAYIPYEENIVCPFCKTKAMDIPKECFVLIDELIVSLRSNKAKEGRYLLGAWYVGSFSDFLQEIIFKIFDAWDKEKPSNGELFITNYINNIKFEENSACLKEYINPIALKIYYRKEELRVGLWTRLISKILS
jgi:hypothetical protein